MSSHRHGVTLDVERLPDGGPGIRPRCQSPRCTWSGELHTDVDAANAEADDHAERWEIEHAVTPFPGAPVSPLPASARSVLSALSENAGTRLSQPEGVSASALARRGLAVKKRRQWFRTRRGSAWARR